MTGEPTAVPLDRIAQVVNEFGLLPDQRVLVACSGGKDSTFACTALRDLGFDVFPLMVDMDYSPVWADRVKNNLASLGFAPTCIRARSGPQPIRLSIRQQSLFDENIRVVSKDLADPKFTACTSCYNSKVLVMLDYLESNSFDRIVFGHHTTDGISSLLKSALMYMDRWDFDNASYDPARFRELAVKCRLSMLNDHTGFVDRITQLIAAGKASTDEPPVQSILTGVDTKIVRPLFDVWESEIISRARDLGSLESSGCGHTSTMSRQTPREIVQYEIVRVAEAEDNFRRILSTLLRQCIDDEGYLINDARRNRGQLLGKDYKPAYDSVDKL